MATIVPIAIGNFHDVNVEGYPEMKQAEACFKFHKLTSQPKVSKGKNKKEYYSCALKDKQGLSLRAIIWKKNADYGLNEGDEILCTISVFPTLVNNKRVLSTIVTASHLPFGLTVNASDFGITLDSFDSTEAMKNTVKKTVKKNIEE